MSDNSVLFFVIILVAAAIWWYLQHQKAGIWFPQPGQPESRRPTAPKTVMPNVDEQDLYSDELKNKPGNILQARIEFERDITKVLSICEEMALSD